MHRRDPASLANGKKKEGSEVDLAEVENHKAKATRHILLIRHSQYNLSGSEDKERYLTALGMCSRHTGEYIVAEC